MSLAADILRDYLNVLRTQFYPDDDKKFFQQRAMLVKGITHLATWLKQRETSLPDRRYRQILDEIIVGIKRHGNTAKIQYFCRYFLHVVQQYVKHNEESLYEESKDLRNALDRLTGDLTAKQARKLEEAREDTTENLAAFARLTKSGPRGKKIVKTATQPTLF